MLTLKDTKHSGGKKLSHASKLSVTEETVTQNLLLHFNKIYWSNAKNKNLEIATNKDQSFKNEQICTLKQKFQNPENDRIEKLFSLDNWHHT